MSRYIAILGNDSATVAAGIKHLLSQNIVISSVLLFEDKADQQNKELFDQRKDALEAWIAKRLNIKPVFKPSEAILLTLRSLKITDPNLSNTWVNFTGGSKVHSVQLALWAQENRLAKQCFTTDAHNSLQKVHYLDGQSRILSSADLLDMQDYRNLYIDPYMKTVPPSQNGVDGLKAANINLLNDLWQRAPQLKQFEPNGDVIKVESRLYFVFVYHGLIYSIQLEPKTSTEHLAQHNRHVYFLGGQLGTALYHKRSQATGEHCNTYAQEMQKLVYRVKLLGGMFLDDFLSPPESQHNNSTPSIHDPQGNVLVSFVGEQPMPTLVAYVQHSPQSVYLLTTLQMEHVAKRLHKYLSTEAKVHVQIIVLDSDNPSSCREVVDNIANVASKTGAKLHVCINGLTKAMAIGGVMNIDISALLYVRGNKSLSITIDSQNTAGETEIDLSSIPAKTVLAVHGAQIASCVNIGLDKELAKYAFEFLKERELRLSEIINPSNQLKDYEAGIDFEKKWKALGQSSAKLQIGTPLEYWVYFKIASALKDTSADIFFAAKVRFLEWKNNDDVALEGAAYDSDALVVHQGQVWWVEVKPSIEVGLSLKESEHRQGPWQAASTGGRFGRAALVAYEKGKIRDEAIENARSERDALGRYELWACKVDAHGSSPAIKQFPERLKDVFSDWGWLP